MSPSGERVEAALAAASADTTNSFIEVLEPTGLPATGGRLAGMPIAVKDLVDQAGRTTTAGSAFYRRTAAATAPALARLEAEGAVVIGRTNLHEFAFGFSSENPWFGAVRNPWDRTLAAGGSSGGSAAAVAAGIVPIALGTDTGGSVRVPAALCGVTGLKVTHGLIPLDGVFPLVPSLDTVGAIAADLDNLELVTRLMAGDRWNETRRPFPPRLVVPDRWLESAPLTPAVSDAFAGFLEGAAAAGFTVEHRELADLAPSPHQGAVIGAEVAAIHGAWRREGRPYGDDVGGRVDAALEVAADQEAITAGNRWRRAVTAAMRQATGEHSLLVTPTVAAMDKVIGTDTIGGHHYRTVLSWFTAPVNPTGCPSLTIPVAGPGRRPGVQLIGDHGSERRLLDVARLLQERGVVEMSRWSSE